METTTPSPREEAAAIASHAWMAPFATAIVLAIGGVIAFIAAGVTSVIAIYVVGVVLVCAGVAEIVASFRKRSRREGSFALRFLAGVLPLVVGVLFLWHPAVGLAGLGLLIAGYLFVSGLFRGIVALMDRHANWGWDVLYGVVSVILAFVLMASWPLSSFLLLGVIIGLELIARAVTLGGLALGLRSLTHSRRGPTAA